MTSVAPGRERGAGDGRLRGVDRDPGAGAGLQQPFDHRQHAPQLLVRATGSAPGPGRLAADVEDRGALLLQRKAVLDRRARVEEEAAVGERVGRDVDDAHEREAGPARVLLIRPPPVLVEVLARLLLPLAVAVARTLIRYIQLIIHTIRATISSATPAPASLSSCRPTTIRTAPTTAIASGSHTRVCEPGAISIPSAR